MASCCDRIFGRTTRDKIKSWFKRFSVLATAVVLVILASAVLIILHFVVVAQVMVNVEDARLDTFAFTTTQGSATTTPFFSYNISVALTVRNTNLAMSIKHTKRLVATFVFHDRRLHNNTVVDEGHRHRPGKTELHPLQATGKVPSFLLGAAAAEDFKKQNATGLFKVEVRLSGEVTYQRILIAKKRKMSMSCPLGLQLAPPGPEVVVFHEVNCKPVKQDKIYF